MCMGTGIAAESSMALPAGSEYEKVSPAEKGDMDMLHQTGTIRSSVDGSRLNYQTYATTPGDRGAFAPNQPLSTRTPGGWTTQGIMPPMDPDYQGAGADLRNGYQTFADDLSAGVITTRGPVLTSDASGALRNAYTKDFASGEYTLLTPAPITPLDPPMLSLFYVPVVAGTTADLRHVVYETSGVELTPDAPVGVSNTYEWVNGTTRLVGLLPDGTPAPGGTVPGRGVGGGLWGSYQAHHRAPGTVSEDGSRIFFTASPTFVGGNGMSGTLYVRKDGRTTQLISGSKRTVADPDGPQPATFLAASPDGRVVLFSSAEKLTNDSRATPGGGGNGYKAEIYRYEVDTDRLTSLNASVSDGVDGVVGYDRSMTTVYLGLNGETGGALVMWRNGVVKVVAGRIGIGQATVNWPWFWVDLGKQSEVSADGRYVVYRSDEPQAGIQPGGASQLFLYDSETDETRCLSCPARGDVGGQSGLRPSQSGALFLRPYLSRNISSDGRRIFFESPQSLVLGDTNGRVDVYQYDTVEKRTELVSTGSSDGDVHFGDASADGRSVFFTTHQRVIPDLDEDDFADVYVARVGATRHQPAPRSLPCSGDRCQGPLSGAPQDDVPGSVLFSGSGDSGDETPRLNVFQVLPLSRKQRSAWARTGRVQLSVRVSDAGRVQATVRGKLGNRASVLARASKSARGGGIVKVTLRLSKPARRQLAKSGTLRVAIAVSYTDGGASQRATLVLRHPSNSTTTKGAR